MKMSSSSSESSGSIYDSETSSEQTSCSGIPLNESKSVYPSLLIRRSKSSHRPSFTYKTSSLPDPSRNPFSAQI